MASWCPLRRGSTVLRENGAVSVGCYLGDLCGVGACVYMCIYIYV